MNIFEQIRKDHETQRTLIDLLVKTDGASEGREELYEKLKKELQVHADAEERYFYRPLMEADLTQDQARHSVAEHQEIDELIEQLDNTEMSSPGWLPTAKKLKESVLHHLDEEEHQVFQMAGKVLSEEQKSQLAQSYRKMMEDDKE